MRNVEAFKAIKVTQNWTVDYQSSRVAGRPEDGRVSLSSDGDALHLFFAERYVDTFAYKWELVYRLYYFCGLDKSKEERDAKFILLQILDTDSLDDIVDILDRASIGPLPEDDEVDAAAERLRKAQVKKSSGTSKHWSDIRSAIDELMGVGGIHILTDAGFGAHLFSVSDGPAGFTNFPNFTFDDLDGLEAISVLTVSNRSAFGRKRRAKSSPALEAKGEKLVNIHARMLLGP
jgi:hypothetical protein